VLARAFVICEGSGIPLESGDGMGSIDNRNGLGGI
ncbi:MAG: hypothetical protein RLZZ140_719, partial [Pseudomonadota bacterium]